MIFFNVKAFSGTVPKLSDRLLPDGTATIAENCKTGTGSLRPIKGMTLTNTPAKAGTKKTIYLYENLHWLHWLEDVDVVSGPIAGDTTGRLYWTGEGVPRVSNASLITSGGGAEYPTVSYTLGIPAPTTAPYPSVNGSSVNPDTAESRSYVYTYVSAWGEEGPPSPASIIAVVEPTQDVDLSDLAIAPTGAYNITHKRIYRTATGSEGTDFVYVTDIPVANTTYNDSKAAAELGESIPSTYWDPPPEDLFGLKLHPSGFLVGISGRDICLSEQYMPHAWPESYKIPIDHKPVGLGIFGTSILVLTEAQPYVITGVEPGFMTKERFEINQACVSKQGIVDIGTGVAYPSPDGLIVVGQGVARNVTEDIYTRDQWQALSPENMIGAGHDGNYYGFSDTGGIITDFKGVQTVDASPSAVHVDAVRDKLFLMIGDNIQAWDDSDASTLSIRWRTGIKVMPHIVASPGVARVVAKDYPVTFKLYGDGVLKVSRSVTSKDPFTLPGGYRAEEFEVELTSEHEIESLQVASTRRELKAVSA